MSSSSSTEYEFQGMMKHLESLYAMAQVLTLDATRAEALVQATFERALRIREKNLVAPGDRRHMLQLMIQVYHEQKQTPPPLPPPDKEPPPPAQPKASFKQHILHQYLRQAVPAAFAALSDLDRVVLSMCEADGRSNADAALILGGDSDSVNQQRILARQRFANHVNANAPATVSQILTQASPEEWIPQALRRTLKSELNAVPPTLEPKIQASFSTHHPEAARRALSSTPKKTASTSHNRLSRGLMTIFLILAAGFIGYIGSSVLMKQPDANLLTLSASKAPRVETVLATTDQAEAEQFVQQQMRWRLTLPDIEQSEFTGVGISEIADEVRVPVFLYRDNMDGDSEYITLYAFTYALLDEYADRIQLESDILQAITREDQFDLHDLNEKQKFVIWRKRDDIFLAVTSIDPQMLRDRITVN